jgi:hypothetical protein
MVRCTDLMKHGQSYRRREIREEKSQGQRRRERIDETRGGQRHRDEKSREAYAGLKKGSVMSREESLVETWQV